MEYLNTWGRRISPSAIGFPQIKANDQFEYHNLILMYYNPTLNNSSREVGLMTRSEIRQRKSIRNFMVNMFGLWGGFSMIFQLLTDDLFMVLLGSIIASSLI